MQRIDPDMIRRRPHSNDTDRARRASERHRLIDNFDLQPMTREKKRTPRAAAELKPKEGVALEKQDAPLYLQVASTLRTAIVRGMYPVGSRIPTEEELCERFLVSRHTVREALRQLRADGLITSRQGGRPVVVPPSALNAVRLFSAEMGKDFFDHTMGTRLVVESMEMTRVSKSLASQMDLPQGEEWLHVTGYRHGENEVTKCWNEYFIGAEYAAIGRLLPRHVGPLIPLIEDLYSEKIVKVHQSMAAMAMSAQHATEFQVAAGTPALKIITRCHTAVGKLALISISLHRGGEVAYSVRLQDRGSAS